MSSSPASNARPVGLALAGSLRGRKVAMVRREEWLPWLILLLPTGSLVFAVLLSIALSWIAGSPAPAPGPGAGGADAEVGTESPDIDDIREIEGAEGITHPELRQPGRLR